MPRTKKPSQASGQAQSPSPGVKRPPKKPKVVTAAERTVKFIESLNPFD